MIKRIDDWISKSGITINTAKDIIKTSGRILETCLTIEKIIILRENYCSEKEGQCYYVFICNYMKGVINNIDIYTFFKMDKIRLSETKKLNVTTYEEIDEQFNLVAYFLKSTVEKIYLKENNKYYEGCKIDTIKGDFL